MRSKFLSISVVLAVMVTLAACGDSDRGDIEEVRAAIAKTGGLTRRFVYSEKTSERTVEVEGLIEDDFRYRAQLSFDGAAAYDEVVSDDAIAARAPSPDGLDFYADGTDEGGALEPLSRGRWVLDATGAPSLSAGVEDRVMGSDPIYDALTVLRYLDLVVLRQSRIVEFNEFDLEYDPEEDPFPTPEEGSDVVRYDVRPPSLPKASDAQGGNQAVPGPQHFRKMAVYVQDGVIIRMLEVFDVAGRLDEIQRNYDIDFPRRSSRDERVSVSIEAINAVRRGQGETPIRVRTMSLDLVDVGADLAVEMPTENVVEASLDLLAFRGQDDLRPS